MKIWFVGGLAIRWSSKFPAGQTSIPLKYLSTLPPPLPPHEKKSGEVQVDLNAECIDNCRSGAYFYSPPFILFYSILLYLFIFLMRPVTLIRS